MDWWSESICSCWLNNEHWNTFFHIATSIPIYITANHQYFPRFFGSLWGREWQHGVGPKGSLQFMESILPLKKGSRRRKFYTISNISSGKLLSWGKGFFSPKPIICEPKRSPLKAERICCWLQLLHFVLTGISLPFLIFEDHYGTDLQHALNDLPVFNNFKCKKRKKIQKQV